MATLWVYTAVIQGSTPTHKKETSSLHYISTDKWEHSNDNFVGIEKFQARDLNENIDLVKPFWLNDNGNIIDMPNSLSAEFIS